MNSFSFSSSSLFFDWDLSAVRHLSITYKCILAFTPLNLLNFCSKNLELRSVLSAYLLFIILFCRSRTCIHSVITSIAMVFVLPPRIEFVQWFPPVIIPLLCDHHINLEICAWLGDFLCKIRNWGIYESEVPFSFDGQFRSLLSSTGSC